MTRHRTELCNFVEFGSDFHHRFFANY